MFQEGKIAVGEFPLRAVFGVAGDELHAANVVPAPHSTQVAVEARLVHVPDDALGTSKDGRVVVQKIYPMVNVVPHWHLVGYVAHHHRLVLALQVYNLSDRLLHGYAAGVVQLSDMLEEPVEALVFQRMV